MITELFLLMITLCAAFTRKSERWAATIYCVISHVFYFIGTSIENEGVIYFAAAISELSLMFLLIAIKGCVKSSLIRWLIPLSIGMIVVHAYGWLWYMNGTTEDNYNQLVIYYWGVMIALFLSYGDWRGVDNWITRVFSSNNTRVENVGMVFKE